MERKFRCIVKVYSLAIWLLILTVVNYYHAQVGFTLTDWSCRSRDCRPGDRRFFLQAFDVVDRLPPLAGQARAGSAGCGQLGAAHHGRDAELHVG